MSIQPPYATLILRWYDQHQRTLPWRAKNGEIPNPYHVLLSEIMLQQTQVTTVIPYFNNFIKKFPTLNDMARTSLDEIMAMWTGLGYYSRARNLHRCVREIAQQGGVVPNTVKGLRALPGIGDYTSAAILSIGYNQPYVPIDGNVERITARLFAVQEPLPLAKPILASLAKTLNNDKEALERPGDFAQGLFDIGATICKPRNPLCLICPLSSICKAYLENIADLLPRREKKPVKPVKYGVSLWIENKSNQALFRKRPEKGVLAGTLELPSTSWLDHFPSIEQAIKETGCLGQYHKVSEIKHVFTHFTLKVRLYKLIKNFDFINQDTKNIWLNLSELDHYPCSSLMKKMIAYSVKTQSNDKAGKDHE